MVKIKRVPVEWVEKKIQNLCAIFLRFLPWLSPTVYTALYFFLSPVHLIMHQFFVFNFSPQNMDLSKCMPA